MYIYIYILHILRYRFTPAHLPGASGQAFCKVSSLQNVIESWFQIQKMSGVMVEAWFGTQRNTGEPKNESKKQRLTKCLPQAHIQAPSPVIY